MKKTLISAIAIIISLAAYPQKTIDNPNFGYGTTSMIKVQKIDLLDTATVLHFKAFGNAGTKFLIPDKTFIQPEGEGEKLFVKSADGIPIGEWYEINSTREASYKLMFPAIKKTTFKIDYGEDNEGGNWFIYDIEINPRANASNLPKEIQGNWFNADTRNWEISFFDTLAVYKSQLWSYSGIALKKGSGSIKLKNKNNQIALFIEVDKSGNCRIGESKDKMDNFTKDLSKVTAAKSSDEKPYETPILKLDSATYSGYFKGYSARFGGKTFNIYVDDIITGNQNTYLGEINSNGYFLVKLPLYYPHVVYVRSGFYNGSVYLEPGKDVFQLINSGNADNSPLFMGTSGKINEELKSLQKFYSFNYNDMNSKITDMKPADYKLYLKNIRDKDLASLDSVNKTNAIGAKAYQVKRLQIEYDYFDNLMSYDMYFESAYRSKYKIPRTQRTLPVKIDTLTAEYFDFITSENANNQLALLGSSYSIFINRLKYLDILHSSEKITTPTDIVEELQKSGYIFSESEKKLVEKIKEQDKLKDNPDVKAFKVKYGKQTEEFYTKYRDTLQDFYKNAQGPREIADIEKYLVGKGVKLTDSEKQLLKAQDEVSQKLPKQDNDKSYSDSLRAFYSKHSAFTNTFFKNSYKEKLDKLFGVKKGFATDIMDAQNVCRGIVEEFSPVSDEELKDIQKDVVTPFISDYIALCNHQSKLKVEVNKLKKGYKLNDVPKTQADVLFDSIMKKYTGKVVYVDFWATWCGPCRSGIEQIKPLKEELAGQNVVFVYITGPSSPEKTYLNMIPDIKGEHYRVSNDEWNYLCSKFNISGIPHYVLVGKKGEILNPALGHLDNNTLKSELVKRMKE